ncbi:serine hydrolase domain-containing protein [Actinopolyspora mortivallis]|uniref:Beta-lactamase-related domain-containing protein n=1 Tax=Actinopolyspora mortivallis TaxID=33906 RepID=A0A2T0GWY3_ACTMO|nr:serine hydrolase [Actinopolyspora mortivallis]PRW63533.1 hypothetical protein CEP50_10075 [Actinopolyspora mortivallis]
MSAFTRRGFLVRLGTGITAVTAGWGPRAEGTAEGQPCSRDGLSRVDPERAGVDPAGVLDFARGLEEAGFAGNSFMLLRGGRVVAEGWWHPYVPDAAQLTYSLTKSVVATAVGFALAEGLLRLDDRVIDVVGDLVGGTPSAHLRQLRTRHLLTMTAGHRRDPLRSLRLPRSAPSTEWTRAVLEVPIDHAPGTRFAYSSGALFPLGTMLHRVTGLNLRQYLRPRLFEPLGIRVGFWEEFTDGANVVSSGLALTTADIAKLGQLHLRRGVWNGRRVLPRCWAERATAKQVDTLGRSPDESVGYGYLFWRGRHNTYRAHGALDQCSVVMPDQDAVLATTAQRHGTVLDLAWGRLLPAMDSAPSTPGRRWDEELAGLRHPVAEGAPVGRTERSGRYVFADNELGVEAITLDIDRRRCSVVVDNERGRHSVLCGVGHWVESRSSLSALPVLLSYSTDRGVYRPPRWNRVAGSAAWPEPDTLRMIWRFLGTPHADTLTLRFRGGTVEVEFANSVSLRGQDTDDRPVLVGRRQNRAPSV